MVPQPSYAQSGSIYYICLLRDELLLHQGMYVLVISYPIQVKNQLFILCMFCFSTNISVKQ